MGRLDALNIDVYPVNLIKASGASNVILNRPMAKEYLCCLAFEDEDGICVYKDKEGVSVDEFGYILDYCLLPQICNGHSGTGSYSGSFSNSFSDSSDSFSSDSYSDLIYKKDYNVKNIDSFSSDSSSSDSYSDSSGNVIYDKDYDVKKDVVSLPIIHSNVDSK